MRGEAAAAEMEVWSGSRRCSPKVPREGSRARGPATRWSRPGGPTGQMPWGGPGRWPPCPILPALTPPPPLGCISCCLPGSPICWPHLSWQPLPRAPLLLPDTWHLSDTDGRRLCFLLPSWKGHWPCKPSSHTDPCTVLSPPLGSCRTAGDWPGLSRTGCRPL